MTDYNRVQLNGSAQPVTHAASVVNKEELRHWLASSAAIAATSDAGFSDAGFSDDGEVALLPKSTNSANPKASLKRAAGCFLSGRRSGCFAMAGKNEC